MRIRSFPMTLLLTCLLPLSSSAQSEAIRKIEWGQLLPKLEPLKDPLAVLTQDQRFDIETIQWARGLSKKERHHPDNRQAAKDAEGYEKSFKKAGLDVAKLLSNHAQFKQSVAKRQKIVNTGLNGRLVRLAGYLLPLEFSDKGVRDFLLVPYLGACIHVPPPPANQIVLVQLSKKFKVVDLFTPAWVVGKLETKASSKTLSFVDGSADIPVGYHINRGSVEIYRQK
jgi:uncharacterized protein